MKRRVPITVALTLAAAAALTGCSTTVAPVPSHTTTAVAAPAPGDIIAQPAQEAAYAKAVADFAQLQDAANGACQDQEMASTHGIGLPPGNRNVATFTAAAADYARYAANLPGYPKTVSVPAPSDDWCAEPGKLIALHH